MSDEWSCEDYDRYQADRSHRVRGRRRRSIKEFTRVQTLEECNSLFRTLSCQTLLRPAKPTRKEPCSE